VITRPSEKVRDEGPNQKARTCPAQEEDHDLSATPVVDETVGTHRGTSCIDPPDGEMSATRWPPACRLAAS